MMILKRKRGSSPSAKKTPTTIDNGEVLSATNDDVTKTLNITNPSEIANNNNITRTSNITADHL